MKGVLEGIRVVDCGSWQQGPVAAAMLGELGADVIKVEEPRRGDPSRGNITVPETIMSIVPYYTDEEVNRQLGVNVCYDCTWPYY